MYSGESAQGRQQEAQGKAREGGKEVEGTAEKGKGQCCVLHAVGSSWGRPPPRQFCWSGCCAVGGEEGALVWRRRASSWRCVERIGRPLG